MMRIWWKTTLQSELKQAAQLNRRRLLLLLHAEFITMRKGGK